MEEMVIDGGGPWPDEPSPRSKTAAQPKYDTAAQPNAAQPQYDDALSEFVASGDISKVRGYFDKVLWEGRKERPDWNHLKIALLREDRPMLRLLGTWGAAPADADMAAFRALAKDKYPAYLGLLRAAGIRPAEKDWETIAPAATNSAADEDHFDALTAKTDSTRLIDQVPGEWRQVLKAFQSAGAEEAVIAGGALRDLFNGKPVKDVDIFLRSLGGERKNGKFLKAVFAATGLNVTGQEVSSGGYGRKTADFPAPQTEKENIAAGQVKRERLMESWKVVAGHAKTEYNVIFVDDSLDRRLMETTPKSDQRSIFCDGLLESFDLGLCRIACDGLAVTSTPEYRDDVKYKRVSLLLPETGPSEHLNRVIKKYPDWQLNPAAQQALAPKPAPARGLIYY